MDLIKDDEIILADEKLAKNILNSKVDLLEYRAAKTYLLSKLSLDEYAKTLLYIAHKECSKVCSAEQGDLIIAESLELLDELDRDININVMRLREWYSFHFPELSDIISEGKEFVEQVIRVGNRKDYVLNKNLEDDKIYEIAKMSMGTEISQVDFEQIKLESESILAMYSQRESLSSFIFAKLNLICPNLVALAGELVAARLISRAGSLLHLSKCPAGTIQLMGAEKALCNARKSKSDTPKYGFIYNSPLIGQVPTHLKGKIARTLAAKIALAAKVDCFGGINTMGVDAKKKIENRLKSLIDAKKKKK